MAGAARARNFPLCGCMPDWSNRDEGKRSRWRLCPEHARQAKRDPDGGLPFELSAAPHSHRACVCHTQTRSMRGKKPPELSGGPSLSWRTNLAYVPPAILLIALSMACRSAGSSTTPGATPTVPTSSGTPGFATATIFPESTAPSILFLVDQSSSMGEDFGGMSRWDAIQQLFSDDESGPLADLATRARIGITIFSGEAGAGGCPLIAGSSPGTDNLEMISSVVNGAEPLNGSPTDEGIRAAARTLEPYQGDRWVVLITDGAPGSCAGADAGTARDAAVGAAAAAFAQRVRVVPVALGDETPADFIEQIAKAGSGVGVDAALESEPLRARDLEELRQALERVAEMVES